MSIKLDSRKLSPAEISFIKWQYGFDEDDDPFERSLWQAIVRAWDSDNESPFPGEQATRHLSRLGAAGAYAEEVALYVKFKSEHSDKFWDELIRRAGLADRRQSTMPPTIERRRRAEARR